MKLTCDKECPQYELCQLNLGGKNCYYHQFISYEYTLGDKILDAIIKILGRKC